MMTAKEIAVELLYRARKEGLPQTRGRLCSYNNGEKSYCALGAIHHYLFDDDNRILLSYNNEEIESILGKRLCQDIMTLNDCEHHDGCYRFDTIAEKIMKEYY